MCHDVSFSIKTFELLNDYFNGLQYDGDLIIDNATAIHHIAQAYKEQPVIVQEDGVYKIKLFEWGLIAPYMNTPEKIKQFRSSMVNARSEKILDKGSAWNRLKNNRCLVPLDGIYEHRRVEGYKNKIPYYVRLHNKPLLLLPGFYNYNLTPNPETGEVKGTFAIITREANSLMAQIHNDGNNRHRMPLFLPESLAKQWLQPNLSDDEIKNLIDFEMPSEAIETWPVFTIRSTKPRPDGKEKNEVFEWENVPDLIV